MESTGYRVRTWRQECPARQPGKRCADGHVGRAAQVASGVWTVADRGIRCDVDGTCPPTRRKDSHIMEYGIGGILVLILVILAIIYFAKRV
jgi:hypothetical protein